MSRRLLTPGGKYAIPKLKKSIVIYQFDCFYEASYIGMTSRQLGKRVKECIPKRIARYCISEETESKSTQVLNNLKTFFYCRTLSKPPTMCKQL